MLPSPTNSQTILNECSLFLPSYPLTTSSTHPHPSTKPSLAIIITLHTPPAIIIIAPAIHVSRTANLVLTVVIRIRHAVHIVKLAPSKLQAVKAVDVAVALAGGHVGGFEVVVLAAGAAVDLDAFGGKGIVGVAVFGKGGGRREGEGEEEGKECWEVEMHVVGLGSGEC